jgi:hypothetical protein
MPYADGQTFENTVTVKGHLPECSIFKRDTFGKKASDRCIYINYFLCFAFRPTFLLHCQCLHHYTHIANN